MAGSGREVVGFGPQNRQRPMNLQKSTGCGCRRDTSQDHVPTLVNLGYRPFHGPRGSTRSHPFPTSTSSIRGTKCLGMRFLALKRLRRRYSEKTDRPGNSFSARLGRRACDAVHEPSRTVACCWGQCKTFHGMQPTLSSAWCHKASHWSNPCKRVPANFPVLNVYKVKRRRHMRDGHRSFSPAVFDSVMKVPATCQDGLADSHVASGQLEFRNGPYQVWYFRKYD